MKIVLYKTSINQIHNMQILIKVIIKINCLLITKNKIIPQKIRQIQENLMYLQEVMKY